MKFNNENLNELDFISNSLIGHLTEVTTPPNIMYMNNNGQVLLVPIKSVEDNQFVNIIDLDNKKRKVSYDNFNIMICDMINCWYNNVPNKSYQKYRQDMVNHLQKVCQLAKLFYN